jgi:hypothetical protein
MAKKLVKSIAVSAHSNTARPRDPTLPIANSLEKVRGYKTLTIYRMQKSPYYYVRLFEDKKILRKSTGTEDRRDAIKFAEKFFVEVKTKRINLEPLSSKSGFEVCALGLQKENKSRVDRNELSQKKLENDEYRLKKDLLPFFRNYEIAEIDYRVISEYVSTLNSKNSDRNLSSSSIKIHISHLKTILRYAQKMGVMNTLPAFPTIKTVDKPRSWFNSAEYSKLHNTARTRIGERFDISSQDTTKLRNGELTRELYDLILFMTNTFIRPTDIRVLQHKHIAIVRSNQVYLRLTHPMTKGHTQPIVSMVGAIDVYDSILKRQKDEGFGKPEDYVFQPQHTNRDYAMQQLYRQFDYLLKISNLKTDVLGEPRTLYSLRHTAIMFRLTESQGLDLLSLARNARTSVEMIDRFYAKHLTAEMNVELIQSNRNDSLRATSDMETIRVKSQSVELKQSVKRKQPAKRSAKKTPEKKSAAVKKVVKNVPIKNSVN